MTFDSVEKIADAILFEGYMLYPYRPSAIKNRQRWNFGTLYPRAFAEAQSPAEPHSFHAEILVEGTPDSTLDFRIRFLQLVPPTGAGQQWEEGYVRARTFPSILLADVEKSIESTIDFTFLADEEKATAPALISDAPSVGKLKLGANKLRDGGYRLQATFSNETPLSEAASTSRKSAQSAGFTSAHLLLHIENGSFLSLLDPPASLASAASECRNQGVFPVLAGDSGDRSTVLCSPIILYDYPQIAPESAGDFFDGTEMDEMLALRVLTLTDEEKREMRQGDPHARAILERTETLPQDHLLKVHGAIRGMRPVAESELSNVESAVQPWNPFDEKPPVDSIRVFDVELRKGDRVRLWPQKRADIMDTAMEGQTATIEAIEQDLENNVQLAVVLDNDPGRDLGFLRQPGHRFFFTPEEVEPLGTEAI
jgi:hypothetical protein